MSLLGRLSRVSLPSAGSVPVENVRPLQWVLGDTENTAFGPLTHVSRTFPESTSFGRICLSDFAGLEGHSIAQWA